MGKIIVESGTIDFEPVGMKVGCGKCPSGCRTVCQRQNSVNFDIVEGDMDNFELVKTMPDYGSFRKRAENKAKSAENAAESNMQSTESAKTAEAAETGQTHTKHDFESTQNSSEDK